MGSTATSRRECVDGTTSGIWLTSGSCRRVALRAPTPVIFTILCDKSTKLEKWKGMVGKFSWKSGITPPRNWITDKTLFNRAFGWPHDRRHQRSLRLRRREQRAGLRLRLPRRTASEANCCFLRSLLLVSHARPTRQQPLSRASTRKRQDGPFLQKIRSRLDS